MPQVSTGLVDIVREFLAAHQLMRGISARFDSGELRFEELEAFVGDGEGSVLYRLKERCHALFRPGPANLRDLGHREALFDLAVGSLFHEAMSFRESFYQREVYGPRMRSLRSQAGAEDDDLFQEFEKILSSVTDRLVQGLAETQALVDRTRQQLRVLLVDHPEDGLVIRYLLEHRELVEVVFGSGIDALLEEMHGSATAGYSLAGRSYLASGYFRDAVRAFDAAVTRGGDARAVEPVAAYARGMAAYLAGDYAESVRQLERWLAAGAPGEPALAALAHAAVSRIGQLVEGDGREAVASAAETLLARLPAGPAPDDAAIA